MAAGLNSSCGITTTLPGKAAGVVTERARNAVATRP